jgi:hypothetical protein
MARASLFLGVLVLLAGCRLTEREAALMPLPEDKTFTYKELLTRARATAAAGLEAFYVDAWPELEDAAKSLEQIARFLPKATEIPATLKDRLAPDTDQLRQDAVKLGEAARAKNARAVNDALQRINLRIRELRPEEKTPEPNAPSKT